MKRKLTSTLMSILLPLTLCLNGYTLPDLGSPSSGALSISEEERLGKLFMETVRKQVHVVNDPILSDYINNFGLNLVAHSNTKRKNFDFFIVDSDEINAFAGPAGHIGINSATILLANNEHELASVLAHEISHVTQHHLARAMERSRGNTLLALAGVAAAILIGSAAGSNAGLGGLMAAQTMNTENQLGYSRSNEHEADRLGLQLLYNSGYDPNGMPAFLHRMAKNHIDLLDGRFSYLRTHPITEERIADVKSRVEQFPKREYTESFNFKLMQTRLNVMVGDYRPGKLNFYSKHKAKNVPVYVQDYGHSLMLLRTGKANAAEKILAQLHSQYPQEIFFNLALADAYVMQRKLNDANQILEKAYAQNANYAPLVHDYAQILIQQKNPAAARKILQRYLAHHKNHLQTLELLSKAQAANGQIGQAYVTRAKLYKLTGQDQHAKMQYQQALKFSPRDKQFIENEMTH